MTALPSAAWTVQQHAWLTALGYSLYVPGAVPEHADSTPRDAVVKAAPAKPSGPAPTRVRPSLPEAPETSRSQPPAARRPVARVPDRLHFALIRACACDPGAEGMAHVMAQWPDPQSLRGNPAAKRALWPILRAMRKTI